MTFKKTCYLNMFANGWNRAVRKMISRWLYSPVYFPAHSYGTPSLLNNYLPRTTAILLMHIRAHILRNSIYAIIINNTK